MKISKSTLFKILFVMALALVPFVMHVVAEEHCSAAYQIAASNGYGSNTGAAIVGTMVSLGWATGALCGVQLLVGIALAG